MKICSGCGKEKELSEFRRNRDARDYHRSECKVCSSERDVGYRFKQQYRAQYPDGFDASKR